MALLKIRDFVPQYQAVFGDRDIISYSVYSDENEEIGRVKDILVDEQTGEFRYLTIEIRFWIFGVGIDVILGLDLCQTLGVK